MKIFKSILAMALTAAFVVGCKEDGYIDPITAVDPGSDEEAPIVTITYPTADVIIPFTEEKATLDFKFQAVDDIEIQSIKASLNGIMLTTLSDFKDYRNVIDSYMYEDLPLGEHTIEITATDMAGKTTTESFTFEVSNVYHPKYDGEVFYMPFEGQLYMEMINETNATVVGTPGFTSNAAVGAVAYEGATDSYLTFPTSALSLGDEFSAAFWINVQETPSNRAGVLVIGPTDPVAPDKPNNRNHGFRLFREGQEATQQFKLNVGTGTSNVSALGGAASTVDPGANEWVHIAFTISPTEIRLYMNGTLAKETESTEISWTDTSILSIMSGAPYFTGWNHLSDPSYMDELRLFNKALTQQQIEQIIDDES